MTPNEVKIFEQSPFKDAIIQLRKWDEMAKSEEPVSEDLTFISELMVRHLSKI